MDKIQARAELQTQRYLMRNAALTQNGDSRWDEVDHWSLVYGKETDLQQEEVVDPSPVLTEAQPPFQILDLPELDPIAGSVSISLHELFNTERGQYLLKGWSRKLIKYWGGKASFGEMCSCNNCSIKNSGGDFPDTRPTTDGEVQNIWSRENLIDPAGGFKISPNALPSLVLQAEQIGHTGISCPNCEEGYLEFIWSPENLKQWLILQDQRYGESRIVFLLNKEGSPIGWIQIHYMDEERLQYIRQNAVEAKKFKTPDPEEDYTRADLFDAPAGIFINTIGIPEIARSHYNKGDKGARTRADLHASELLFGYLKRYHDVLRTAFDQYDVPILMRMSKGFVRSYAKRLGARRVGLSFPAQENEYWVIPGAGESSFKAKVASTVGSMDPRVISRTKGDLFQGLTEDERNILTRKSEALMMSVKQGYVKTLKEYRRHLETIGNYTDVEEIDRTITDLRSGRSDRVLAISTAETALVFGLSQVAPHVLLEALLYSSAGGNFSDFVGLQSWIPRALHAALAADVGFIHGLVVRLPYGSARILLSNLWKKKFPSYKDALMLLAFTAPGGWTLTPSFYSNNRVLQKALIWKNVGKRISGGAELIRMLTSKIMHTQKSHGAPSGD